MPSKKQISVDEKVKSIKLRLEEQISKKEIDKIILFLNEYVKVLKTNKDSHSRQSIVKIMENQIDQIYNMIREGLTIDSNNFKLLFQLKFIYHYQSNIVKLNTIESIINSLINKTRRYIDPKYDIYSFFSELNKEEIQYVILRWFEDLPNIKEGENIDLLIQNHDLDKINKYLIPFPIKNAQPIDIYSCSGLRGSDYAGLPYYPKHIAETIISHRVLFKDNYYIPNSEDYLLSFIYHVVYHKAEKSALPIDKNKEPIVECSDHNYGEIINELFKQHNIEKGIDLTSLHQFLCEKKWNPNIDLIRKLGKRSKWLASLYPPQTKMKNKHGEMMVFIIKGWASKRNKTEEIIKYMEDNGLNVILIHEVDLKNKRKVSRVIKEDNLGYESYQFWRELPLLIVVAYDYHPIPMPNHLKKQYPFVTNRRYLIKRRLKNELNKSLADKVNDNGIYSSDDELEAWEYINIICPELIPKIKNSIDSHVKSYMTKEQVIKRMKGNNTRGKTEIIRLNGKSVIKKTYKPGRERYLKREIYAYKELSQKNSLIPPLLDSGDNYIIIPYYGDLLERVPNYKSTVIKKNIYEISRFMHFLYEEGFAHLDFHPGNVIYSIKEGIKIIDFEFLYKYKEQPNTIIDSYDISGVPKDFEEDLPLGWSIKLYNDLWNEICGYNLEEITSLGFE